jgi:hypothetical protein
VSDVQDKKLVRTCVDGDPHTLVLRQESAERSPNGPLFDLPSGSDPSSSLAVTYQESARFLHEWQNQMDRRPQNLGVVSVGEQMRSAATDAAAPNPPGHTMVRGVADSTDTEELHETVRWYLDAWPTIGETVTYFDSVSNLVEDVGVDAATDFLQEFLRMLDAHGAVGYFCLETTAHDRAVVREVASLFDTVIESVDAAADATAEPSVSDCFEAISDYRRRLVMTELAETDEARVSYLAERMATQGSAEREQAQAALIGVQLPKLADLGVVAYDRERGTVTRGEHFDRVEPFLEKAVEQR